MPMTTAATMDQLDVVLADLVQTLDRVTTEQLTDPTPCDDWDVAALREHILGWLETFAAGLADPDGRTPRADLTDYRTPADPVAAARTAHIQLGQAVRSGATERPLWLGEARLPGEVAFGMIQCEYVVHGWDLSRALGTDWQPPDAAVEAALAAAEGMLTPEMQGAGKPFAPAVPLPSEAPLLDRLLARTGRDPQWSTR